MSSEAPARTSQPSQAALGDLTISFGVADVAKSAEFYKRLGFSPADEDRWDEHFAAFRYQGLKLLLMDFIPQKVLVNLELPDQAAVDSARARLADEGIPVGPAGTPESGNKGAFWQDPDGNSFFLFTNHPER